MHQPSTISHIEKIARHVIIIDVGSTRIILKIFHQDAISLIVMIACFTKKLNTLNKAPLMLMKFPLRFNMLECNHQKIYIRKFF